MCVETSHYPMRDNTGRVPGLFYQASNYRDDARDLLKLALSNDWSCLQLREALCDDEDNPEIEHYNRGILDAYELMREVRP